MIYQLQTGKIVHLSIEEYLSLTEDDISYLIATNFGHFPSRNQSVLGSKKPEIDPEIDPSIDYTEESDELSRELTKIDILYLEEIGEDLSDVDFSDCEE